MVPAAHASDGGGSIRIPASACGLVGLKVSQGRTSLGPLRDESGLGVEHVLTRSVRDCAALLDATHGPAPGDTVIAPAPSRLYLSEVGADPGRLRIGLMPTHPTTAVHPDCEAAARGAAALLERLGHQVDEAWPAVLGDTTFASRFTALWSSAMAMAIRGVGDQLGRPLGPDDVEPVNWAMAETAAGTTGPDVLAAQAAMGTFRRALAGWWAAGWDLLLTPTLAEPPPRLGTLANDPANPLAPLARSALLVPFTPPFNASGQPAISLPLHQNPDGLPVGVQLVAAYGREDVLVRVAAQLEAAAPWAGRRPPGC